MRSHDLNRHEIRNGYPAIGDRKALAGFDLSQQFREPCFRLVRTNFDLHDIYPAMRTYIRPIYRPADLKSIDPGPEISIVRASRVNVFELLAES